MRFFEVLLPKILIQLGKGGANARLRALGTKDRCWLSDDLAAMANGGCIRGPTPARLVLFVMVVVMAAANAADASTSAALRHPSLRRMAAEVAATDESEPLQVFKVENPLSRARFGDLLGNLDLYHTGVLVYSRALDKNYTFEFTARVFGAFFPTVDAAGEMHWNDFGFVQPVHGWNEADWERVQYVADITASGFQDYLGYVQEFNVTHTEYELFQLQGPGRFVQVRAASAHARRCG